MNTPRQLDSLYSKKEAHNKEIWKQIKYHKLLLDGELIFGTSQDKLDRCLTIRGLLKQLWK
jgi:hypothetical protein